MSTIKIKKAIFALAVLSLAACEKPVKNIDGPKVDPKLVIACFISPQDTFIKVSVSESTPFFGATQNQFPQPITNATVIISEGGKNQSLSYDNFEDRYFVSTALFPIVAGKTYNLLVTTPAGLSATAECTVPDQGNNSLVISIDSSSYVTNWGDSVVEYILTMDWTDAAGKSNYYRTTADLIWQEGPDSFGNYYSGYNPFYLKNNYDNNYEGLINDKEMDGQKLSVEGVNQLSQYSRTTSKKAHVSLLHTDKHYFLYHETVFRSVNTGGNPFAEPVLVYTNVKNGLGVFAAFNNEYKVIDF